MPTVSGHFSVADGKMTGHRVLSDFSISGGGGNPMALILSPNLCLLFFRDPEVKFTTARLKQVLGDRGVTVTGSEQPFALRWSDGPTLYASITRGQFVEVFARRLMGRGRKHRNL